MLFPLPLRSFRARPFPRWHAGEPGTRRPHLEHLHGRGNRVAPRRRSRDENGPAAKDLLFFSSCSWITFRGNTQILSPSPTNVIPSGALGAPGLSVHVLATELVGASMGRGNARGATKPPGGSGTNARGSCWGCEATSRSVGGWWRQEAPAPP